MERTSQELSDLQKKLTQEAIQLANQKGYFLDLSNNSVQNVESILKQYSDKYSQREEFDIEHISLVFCAYIISVIEHNFTPGVWKRNHAVFGRDTYPYYWRGNEMFMRGWCYKSIVYGEQDNVWAKYESFVLTKSNKSFGDKVKSFFKLKK